MVNRTNVNPIRVVSIGASQATDTPFFDTLALIIHKVHGIYRIINKTNLYAHNYISTLTGVLLDVNFGHKKIVQIAAQTVAITATLIEAFKEKTRLTKACEKTVDAIKNPYLLTPSYKWEKEKCFSLISPSTISFIKKLGRDLFDRIKRIFFAFLSIFKRLFIFSMKLMDIKDAFSFTDGMARERVREFFLNFNKCVSTLEENKHFLISCLKEKKHVIKELLDYLGSVFTVDQLIQAVMKSLNSVTKVSEGVKKASGGVKEILSYSALGIFNTFGLIDWMPESWVPELNLSHNKRDPGFKYPPKHWVQICSHIDRKGRKYD